MERRTFVKKTTAAGLGTVMTTSTNVFNDLTSSKMVALHTCIFSKHMQWLGISEMSTMAKELGFTGIDLTVRDKGHVLPERVRTDLPEAVAIIRDAGLEVPMITTGITDPDDPFTTNILETAGDLGIKIYRTGWYRFNQGMNVRELLKHAGTQLKKLQDINRSNNIRGAYQNHSGPFLGSSGWDLLWILDGLDPRWMGVQFDICHATAEGLRTWPYVFEMLAPYINSMDIKDFTWKADAGEIIQSNVPLGKGTVDFKAFFEMVKEHNISTDLSMHFEYPLGGAEHGETTIDIPAEEYKRRVKGDIDFLKSILG